MVLLTSQRDQFPFKSIFSITAANFRNLVTDLGSGARNWRDRCNFDCECSVFKNGPANFTAGPLILLQKSIFSITAANFWNLIADSCSGAWIWPIESSFDYENAVNKNGPANFTAGPFFTFQVDFLDNGCEFLESDFRFVLSSVKLTKW